MNIHSELFIIAKKLENTLSNCDATIKNLEKQIFDKLRPVRQNQEAIYGILEAGS